jgi:predicted ATPase
MERAAGLAHDDTPRARLDKLDAVLAKTSTRIEDVALFAEMLSLPNDGRYPAIELTPEQRRQRTLEALTQQLAGLASQNPVLMIFEDAHWTDPTSLEAFARVVDQLRSLRVLLVVTFRPEFEPPWIGRPYVTALTINRLAQRDAEALIDRVVGNKLIPASVRQDIIERSDGIPLFAEEMTKAVLEAESEDEAQRTAAAVPSPFLAVPASLHASLMARLDRLGPAKEVAQIGAAIGREFSHAVLAAVTHKAEAELQSALTSNGGRVAVPAGCATTRDLFVQTRIGTGRGLWHAVARATTGTSCSHCRNSRRPVRGHRRDPARTAGASLHRGRADREGRGPVGQSRTKVTGASRAS